MKTELFHRLRPRPRKTSRLLLDLALSAAVLAGVIALTSCAEYPVAITVRGDHGTYSYSAKSGVSISIHPTK